MSSGYAKFCSSVQDHNQSLIHSGSGWTSQRVKEFILKLKASEENASEENAHEDDIIKSKVIRNISLEVTSPEA